jgi:hypothetical protein
MALTGRLVKYSIYQYRIAAVGIVFYRQINGALYELVQGNTMRIAFVG